jgi:hypothetical protein
MIGRTVTIRFTLKVTKKEKTICQLIQRFFILRNLIIQDKTEIFLAGYFRPALN